MKDDSSHTQGPSRRGFLYSAGAMGVLGSTAAVAGRPANTVTWAQEYDIVIVGSGAGGLSSAVAATRAGSSVVILDCAPTVGGTTARSAGGYWIPNNLHLRAKGVPDPREDVISYMARISYPVLYRHDAPRYGLDEHRYSLIETYVDNAAPITDELDRLGILKGQMLLVSNYLEIPQDKVPAGRCLVPSKPDGSIGGGLEMVRQFRAWLTANQVPVLLKHRVSKIMRNSVGEVVGVSATTEQGEVLIRGRKGVIFATGGYTHNLDFITTFQPGPVYGGCANPFARGDFISLGIEVGAQLGNMSSAWRSEVILDQAMQNRSVSKTMETPAGDSMIYVNKYGRRVVNEKRNYNDRTKAHYVWDEVKSEFPNQFLFMVYDRRSAELFAGAMHLPEPGTVAEYVITAPDIPALAKAIQARLDGFREKIGDLKLAPDFPTTLKAQIDLFSRDARKGIDSQFRRGAQFYDIDWHLNYISPARTDTKWPQHTGPNYTMYPFEESGPYFAIIVAPGALDTNGGPVINAKSQVLDTHGKPISGLYGTGNCIAAPAGQGYWGPGTTLGPAITFGTIAARALSAERVKDI